MKLLKVLIIYAITVFSCDVIAAQTGVVIIVNELNNEAIDKAYIRDIYSDLISQWGNGNTIQIIELSPRSSIREKFSENLMGISARESASAWANRKITNTMRNAKPKIKRESAAISMVKRNPNAIAYVSAEAIKGQSGIKILAQIK